MAMPADALVWVEDGRTGAEMIPMISGQAKPVATSIGRGRQQGYGRQRRRDGDQHGKLTHFFPPMLGLVGRVSWWRAQTRQRRATAAPSESTHGPKAEDRRPGWLLIRHSPDSHRFRPKFAAVWRSCQARSMVARCRRAPGRSHRPIRCDAVRGASPPPTSLVPR